jgi:hypothetical protein
MGKKPKVMFFSKKNPRGGEMPKRKGTSTTQAPDASDMPSEELQAVPVTEHMGVGLVARDRFEEAVRGLQDAASIRNDRGEEVPFEGETKDVFIGLFEKAYPVVGSMMQSLYDTGHLLSEVRKSLKPKKLFLTWIKFTGIPERTAYNYLRVYEGFGEHLPHVSHLGIKRLLIASRVPNCVEYVQDNEEVIASEPAEELAERIRILKATKKKKRGGRKPIYVEVGGCKVRPSGDGTKITIDGLTEKRQKEILEGIKKLLSQAKE